MLDPRERFFPLVQAYFGPLDDPAAECYCSLWDWDQLRLIKVKGTAKFFPPEEDADTSIFARYFGYLALDVHAITIDDDGLLTGISTDPVDDETSFVAYQPLDLCDQLSSCPTIYFSQLSGLDRLGPGVDLLSYNDRKVVFKFNPLRLPQRLEMSWKELNIISQLPPHPNLVPFDHIVLEDKESRIIGFTTKFIPGGTLTDLSKPFRFEWLQQLTRLVDFLNLELGIMHQDIAPRNLLIDPETENILLFDFDCAARGPNGPSKGRDDVIGIAFTLHELITNDAQFTEIPHWDRNIEMVQNIDWARCRELDCDVSKFRSFLNEWIAKRTDGGKEQLLNMRNQLTWPPYQDPHDYDVPIEVGPPREDGTYAQQKGERSRRKALAKGQYCFRWERPPQSRSCTPLNHGNGRIKSVHS